MWKSKSKRKIAFQPFTEWFSTVCTNQSHVRRNYISYLGYGHWNVAWSRQDLDVNSQRRLVDVFTWCGWQPLTEARYPQSGFVKFGTIKLNWVHLPTWDLRRMVPMHQRWLSADSGGGGRVIQIGDNVEQHWICNNLHAVQKLHRVTRSERASTDSSPDIKSSRCCSMSVTSAFMLSGPPMRYHIIALPLCDQLHICTWGTLLHRILCHCFELEHCTVFILSARTLNTHAYPA